jgi:hypothetical protein
LSQGARLIKTETIIKRILGAMHLPPSRPNSTIHARRPAHRPWMVAENRLAITG